ncbi:MAG: outer membrane lipoprotein carrier protein LolA [Phycisphaeraceae bacterium]
MIRAVPLSVTLLAGMLLTLSLVVADEGAAPEGIAPELWHRLSEIDARGAEIETLIADVVQEKHTLLLRRPLRSSGRVWVRGETMRWDTREPRETQMLVTPSEVQLYYPEQALLEIYPVDERLGELTASPLPRLKTMAEHFVITEEPVAELLEQEPTLEGVEDVAFVALRLTPRDEALAEHMERVEVLLEPGRAVARRLVMVDADGERTVITFNQLRLNEDVEESHFELSVPLETRIVRALEGGS